MSRTGTWLSLNAALCAGVLAMAVAVYGCGSDDESSEGTPDGGEASGGGFGSGGSGSGGSFSQGGTQGAGGEGGARDGGVGDGAGAGGASAGTGGSGMQQGGQGGMSMSNPDAGMQLQCVAGGMCSGNETCNRGCANNRTVTCACISGRLFCSNCERSPDGGTPMNPNACPESPQAAACDAEMQPFCQYGSNQQNRGVCVCSGGKFYCPNLPPPAGSPMCPTNPGFKQCMTEGSICAQDQNQACHCTRLGMDADALVWICR